MPGMRYLLSLLALAQVLATGCATTSSDFRMDSLTAKDAAIAGRIKVVYNGKSFTENCSATFHGRAIRLDREGIVLFKVDKGWTGLERIDCVDVSNQHVRFEGARFHADGNGWVSDFGDVLVTWRAPGGFKASAMFGLIGAAIDEASDDGKAQIDVGVPAAEVRAAFRRQTGAEGRWVERPMSKPK